MAVPDREDGLKQKTWRSLFYTPKLGWNWSRKHSSLDHLRKPDMKFVVFCLWLCSSESQKLELHEKLQLHFCSKPAALPWAPHQVCNSLLHFLSLTFRPNFQRLLTSSFLSYVKVVLLRSVCSHRLLNLRQTFRSFLPLIFECRFCVLLCFQALHAHAPAQRFTNLLVSL